MFLERLRQHDSKQIAFMAPGRSPLTFGGLTAQLESIGRSLRGAGISRNDRVVMVVPNSPETAVAFLGIASVASCAPLNPSFRQSEFEFYLEDLRAKALVVGESPDSPAVAAAEKLGVAVIRIRQLADTAGVFQLDTGGKVHTGPLDLAHDDDVALVLHTSGTTAKPKIVPLRHSNLSISGANICTHLALSSEDRALHVMPLFHIHGLMTMFASVLAGASGVVPPGFVAPKFFELLEEFAPTWYSAVPTIHQAVLARAPDHLELIKKRHLRFIRSASSALPPAIMQKMEETFGTPVVEAYAMTEAAHQVTMNPLPPKARKAGSVGVAAGPEVAIMGPDGGLLPQGKTGEIVLRGPSIMHGYENNPDPRAFVNGWFRTGDQGHLDPEGYLYISGRIKEIINRAGEKVSPREVDDVLIGHPAVAEVVTFAVPDAALGEAVGAAIVLKAGAAATTRELQAFVAERLADYKVPTVVVFVEQIPKGGSGKVARIGMAEKLGVGSRAGVLIRSDSPEALYVAPSGPTQTKIAAIWSEVLARPKVGASDDFFNLGGDSVLATMMLTRIREQLGAQLSFLDLLETPTVAGISARVETASKAGGSTPSASTPVVGPDKEANEPFALSSLQQAYWLGQGRDFDLGGINAHRYSEFTTSTLDVERLSEACQKVIERHDMLRAVVLPEGLVRVHAAPGRFAVEYEDLRGLSAQARDSRINATRERMRNHGPPTDQWPSLSILAQQEPEGFRIHIAFSILFCDGWSFQIFLRELGAYYQNPRAVLPRPGMSFRQYRVAADKLRDTESYKRSLTYWRARIDSLPPAPGLPLARPVSSIEKTWLRRRSAHLPKEAWQQLKAFASRHKLTPSIVTSAAYSEVLTSWSKDAKFSLNVLYFNRRPLHPDVENIIGSFSTTLLVEIDNLRSRDFLSRCQRIQTQMWSDLANSEVDGVDVIRELARHHGFDTKPAMPYVFTSMFRNVGADSGLAALGWKRAGGGLQTPQVYLDHQAIEEEGALSLNWDSIDELFPSGLLDDMFETYVGLLKNLASSADSWVGGKRASLPPHSLARRAQANATDVKRETGLLQSLVVEQLQRDPEAPAVICGNKRLSVAQLHQQASGVANTLRALDVRPDQLVAIAMEKGWEQVVAALGVVQSGAAYLPVDMGLPRERILYLLKHGEVRAVLTQPRFKDSFDWPEDVVVNAITDEVRPDAPRSPPPPPCTPRDLAYVIYTSGSTGVPKGVMIEHACALNTLHDINGRFKVGPRDRVLALSSLSFDLSVWDVFGVLGAGGAVVVPPVAASRDPAQWLELIKREHVTIWNSVPALMELLVQHAEETGQPLPPSLRLVMMSGDWIPLHLPDRIRKLAPSAEIISLGGATEASIWSIYYPIRSIESHWVSVPYGFPMENQRFHVLNQFLEPSPDWVPGHLHIAGQGLARGYWRDPQKTAERFITSPTGERLYCTGDLGRYWPSGEIEFLGREDHQVKVRGFRIELGEVEAALRRSSVVRDTVVVAREAEEAQAALHRRRETDSSSAMNLAGRARNLRLVAYIVPASAVPWQDLSGEARPSIVRKSFRVAAQVPCQFAPVGGAWSDGVLTDISEDGACIKTKAPSNLAGQLSVRLKPFADAEEVVLTCDLRWTTGSAIGVEFAENTPSKARDYARTLLHEQGLSFEKLRSHMAEIVPEYLVPSAFVLMDWLPLTSNGKVDRRRLPAPREGRSGGDSSSAPRDEVELRLSQLWAKILGATSVGINDSFFELGGDSIRALRLVSAVEKEFGRRLPVSALLQGGTVAGLASLLRRERVEPTNTHLVPFNEVADRAPFFCVHPVGGNVLCYYGLARALGANQGFYGIQAPGLSGEPLSRWSIQELAQRYLASVRERQPSGPYFLGGWSLGGVVAYEMARQLREQGEQRVHVFMIDSWARRPTGPKDDIALLTWFVRDLAGAQGRTLSISRSELAAMPETGRLAFVLEAARAAGVLAEDVQYAQLERLLAVFKTNANALDAYHPPRYAGPVTLVRATEAATEDFVSSTGDETLGFGACAQSVQVTSLPANHYTLLTAPNVTLVAQAFEAFRKTAESEAKR